MKASAFESENHNKEIKQISFVHRNFSILGKKMFYECALYVFVHVATFSDIIWCGILLIIEENRTLK